MVVKSSSRISELLVTQLTVGNTVHTYASAKYVKDGIPGLIEIQKHAKFSNWLLVKWETDAAKAFFTAQGCQFGYRFLPQYRTNDTCKVCEGKGTLSKITDEAVKYNAVCYGCKGGGKRLAINFNPSKVDILILGVRSKDTIVSFRGSYFEQWLKDYNAANARRREHATR